MSLAGLNQLLESLPGYSLLTDGMKNTALAGALIPDSEGRWPQDADYVTTHDIYFAAMSLLPFLQAQPMVTATGSEGTSITATPFNWGALRAFYSGLSAIVSGPAQDVLVAVPIPDSPHVKRVPMNDRGGYYGDVDTDVG